MAPEPKPFRRRELRPDEGLAYNFGANGENVCTIIDLRYVGDHDHPIHTVAFFHRGKPVGQFDADANGPDAHGHAGNVLVNHQTFVGRDGEPGLSTLIRVGLSEETFGFLMELVGLEKFAKDAAPHLARFRDATLRICGPYSSADGVAKAAAELAIIRTTAQVAEAALGKRGFDPERAEAGLI